MKLQNVLCDFFVCCFVSLQSYIIQVMTKINYQTVTLIVWFIFGCSMVVFCHQYPLQTQFIHKKSLLLRNNCIAQKQVLVQKINPQQHLRHLQTAIPHPFKISGILPQSSSLQINLKFHKRMFRIAAKFFEVALQVTNVSQQTLRYPSNQYTCGNAAVPQTYRSYGFDQAYIDTVIFVDIIRDSNTNIISWSQPCVLARWPIYGYIKYNAYYMQANTSKTGDYQNSIYVIMHSLTHILGMNQYLFTKMYGSYTSSQFLSQSQYLWTDIIGRKYIITPNVKAYVQEYFSCYSNDIGGLLEQQGVSGSVGSHWQTKVYYDDYMTAAIWPSGFRVTGITLNLLKDSGYYYSVDTSKIQFTFFGKRAGCEFAKGLSNRIQQYCSPIASSPSCGFYNLYGGYCAIDSFSSGSYNVRPYRNVICQYPQYAQGIPYENSVYSTKSRCFNVNTFSSRCFQATCSSSGVQITVDGQTGICAIGDSTKTISGYVVNCPNDHQLFCGIKSCQNWCFGQALCLNDACLLIQCQLAVFNCLSCINDSLMRCISCSGTLYPSVNRLECVSCSQSITNCNMCEVRSNFTRCNKCSNSLFPSNNNLACVQCLQAISDCLSCTIIDNLTRCSTCREGLISSNNRRVCTKEACTIPNCQVCTTVNFLQICSTCKNNFYLSTNKDACQSCDNIIDNCQQCSQIITGIHCLKCYEQYVLNDNTGSCENCQKQHCKTCHYQIFENIKILACDSCTPEYQLFEKLQQNSISYFICKQKPQQKSQQSQISEKGSQPQQISQQSSFNVIFVIIPIVLVIVILVVVAVLIIIYRKRKTIFKCWMEDKGSQYEDPSSTLSGIKECAICLFPDMTHKTPCGHLFHQKCISDWHRNIMSKQLEPTCPLCRRQLTLANLVKI